MLTYEELFLIFIVAFLAESYGTIVGGGSFVIQPFLMYMGIPPIQAVTHDIIAGFATTVGGISGFAHKKRSALRLDIAKQSFFSLIIGSLLGLYCLFNYVNEDFIKYFIGCLSLLMVGLTWIEIPNKTLVLNSNNFTVQIVGFFIGFYISFSSAGTGVFATIALTSLIGLTYTESIATRKLLFVPAFFISFSYLIFSNNFIFELTITLVIACLLAGYFGIYVINFLGENLLKFIFRIAVVFLSIYILFFS